MPPSIPDDLHHEILVRLPAKSVGRFRCVSKRWLSLTTDPHFMKAHSSTSPIVTSGFYLYNSFAHKPELFVPLNGYNESLPSHSPLSFLSLGGSQATIIHSCNGLILCRDSDKIGRLLSVCNPTTREHVVIHVPKNVEPSEFSLAFDPSVSPNFKVFGLINKSVHGRPLYSIYRFSSENPSWELLYDNVNNADGYFLSRRSAFWNGRLCWKGKDWVHCLDAESKRMSRLRLPQVNSPETCGYFGVSEGRLHCVVKNSNTCYAVYQMESSSTRWSLLHGVKLGSIEDVYPEARRKQGGRLLMKVIGFLRGGGDEVGDRLLLSIPDMVVLYHFNDQRFSICCRLPTYGNGEFPHFGVYIHPHACTLSPLNASTPHKNWLCWKSEHDTLLIRLLVENSLKGQRTVHGFKEHAWDDMVEKFNETTKLNYAVNHLKDRFASYRHDYKLMNRLLKYKGFYWNPEKQMLIASDADWKRRQALVIHKRKQVPFRDFKIIFASSTTDSYETNERACISKERDKESPRGTQNSLPLKRKKRGKSNISAL